MISDKVALKYAKALKEYCGEQPLCDGCVFEHRGGKECLLFPEDYFQVDFEPCPYLWNLGEAEQRVNDQSK